MPDSAINAVVASCLAAAVTTSGIYAIRRYGAWARDNAVYFISFAAGVLIAVSLLHLVPTAISMATAAPAYVFAGYLTLYTFNRFVTAYVCDRPAAVDHALGLTAMAGIGVHSFVDGIVYAVGFTVSPLTGALQAVGMVLHEFPEGIVTYALLLHSGFAPARSFRLAFLAAALTTPLGAVAALPFLRLIAAPQLGLLLALSAGSLLYVGATHLLPRAEHAGKRYTFVALAGGILVAFMIMASHG